MKKIIKGVFFILLIIFTILYLGRNYINHQNESIMTQEAILQFEQDLKEGKEIIPSNYMPQKKNYNNKMCIIGLKISKMIEKISNKVLKKILNSIRDD